MLLVELGQAVDPVLNARAIILADRIRGRGVIGVCDVVPGYGSVGIHYDPLQADLAALERAILIESAGLDAVEPARDARVIEIPVVYGGDAGPDLESVAAVSGCTSADVIARHASRTYRVYMLGFVPGFAYMGRVDASIAVPRHRVPRERVPAGSVGIAGEQTGVYPIASPGGWQLIGRTDVRMFDAARTPASLLAAGDLVRFVRARDGGS